MTHMIHFPSGFLWGAATSAYQVEGGNVNSDWWQWEKEHLPQSSGQACQHFQRFREDFDLARELGHNAHRFSVEWARIEPQEGRFDEGALQHYRQVLRALQERSLTPIVTLHHFTTPLWLARRGGWCNPYMQRFFLRYVERVVESLAEFTTFWITINEPLVYTYHGYLIGDWPPHVRSFKKAAIVRNAFIASHCAAYRLIRDLYRRKRLPLPRISIAKNMPHFVPCRGRPIERLAVRFRRHGFITGFLNELVRRKALDFIGINYYTRNLVEVRGPTLRHFAFDECTGGDAPLPKNDMGWEIYPQGLYEVGTLLKRYGLPLMVTENGICASDEAVRWKFIADHLTSLHRLMEEGSNVLGYLYWSLMDNFEWDKGMGPRFGLIHVDYDTQQRTVRESARRFAEVCRTNSLPS